MPTVLDGISRYVRKPRAESGLLKTRPLPSLVLWDIDHTLIEGHGVNKETYALAFRLLTGREVDHRARTVAASNWR